MSLPDIMAAIKSEQPIPRTNILEKILIVFASMALSSNDIFQANAVRITCHPAHSILMIFS